MWHQTVMPLLKSESSLLLRTPQQRLNAFQWVGQPPNCRCPWVTSTHPIMVPWAPRVSHQTVSSAVSFTRTDTQTDTQTTLRATSVAIGRILCMRYGLIIMIIMITRCRPNVVCCRWWVTLHMRRLGVLQTTTDDRRQQRAKQYWPLHYV